MNLRSQKIVILGSNGLVGSKVREILEGQSLNILYPPKKTLDTTNLNSIRKYIKLHRPQLIINLAAYTNISEAEKQRGNKKGMAWKLNAESAGYLANVCEENSIFLIHLSTDEVFPGNEQYPGPYSEADTPPNNSNDLNWYGYSKLVGEQKIIKCNSNFAVIRISYPFGNSKSDRDFLIKTLHYLKSKKKFVNDQKFTPTYIPDLARAFIKISKLRKKGIFHVSCRGISTPLQFADHVNKTLNIEKKILSQSNSQLLKLTSIKRSRYGGLNNERTQKLLGVEFIGWKKAIEEEIKADNKLAKF